MKLNYRNFTRLGENFEEARIVPSEYVRKPKVLHVIEVIQLLIAAGFMVALISMGFVVSVPFVVCALLLVLWAASSILLATDDYRYLVVGTLTGIASLVAVGAMGVASGSGFLLLSFSAILVLYLGVLHLHKPCKTYYKWAKSVGA